MPSYDYTCENGHLTTQVRPILEDQTVFTCSEETCNSTLSRVYSATAVILKGPGFYSTRR